MPVKKLLISWVLLSWTTIGLSQKLTPEAIEEIIYSKKTDAFKENFLDSIVKTNHHSIAEIADINHSLGTYYYISGNLKKGLPFTRQAVNLRSQGTDTLALKKSLLNLGIFLNNLNKKHEAIKHLKKCVTLGRSDKYSILAYSELMILYYRIADFEKSIDIFKKTKAYNLKTENYYNLVRDHITMGALYRKIGPKKYVSENIYHLKKAEEYLTLINPDNKEYLKYVINHNLGNAYDDITQPHLVRKYYHAALNYGIKTKSKEKSTKIYSGLIYQYRMNNEMELAKKMCEEGLKCVAEANNRSQAIFYNNLAEYYIQIKDFEKGRYYMELSVNKLLSLPQLNQFKNPPFKAFEKNISKYLQLELLIDKAEFWITYHKHSPNASYLENAFEDLLLADKLVDRVQRQHSDSYSKIICREKAQLLYNKAIEISYTNNKPELYFYYMEKNKAMLLQEAIIENEFKNLGKLPDSLRLKEKGIRVTIQKLETSPNITNNDSLQQELFQLKEELHTVRKDIKNLLPNYQKQLNKRIPSLSDVQNHLVANEVLLEYTSFNNNIYGLFIAPTESIPFRIENLHALKSDINQLTSLLNTAIPEKYTLISNDVYQQLIPKHIARKLQGKRLTIIPDGILNKIPFDALITDTQTKSYLIESAEISYALSHTFHKYNQTKTTTTTENSLISFAPKSFVDNNLKSLEHTNTEVGIIHTIIPKGISYVGEKATKSKFLKEISNYKIIHLATHAEANDTISPWIAFHNDKLNLKELYLTNNNAELIVLSACKTNLGEMIKGEGVMSLTRGFFQTGAKSVISSLWNVDDEATSTIMASFYSYLNEGKTKTAALRLAKLDYMESVPEIKRSPYFWASFVLIGNTNSIAIPNTSSWIFYTAGIIAILIALIMLLKRFRRPSIN